MVRAGAGMYAIPSAMIEQVRQVKEKELAELTSAGEATWQERRYALSLSAAPARRHDHAAGGEARHAGAVPASRLQRVAVQVDEMIGNQEIVVKNIGPQLARVAGITGATVLGTGEIVLIINPVILSGRESAAIYEPVMPAPPTDATQRVPTASATPTIMVVDDSLTVRKITGRLLAREGYEVLTAKDGVDALEQLQDVVPDVMLRRHRDAAHGRLRPDAQRARRPAPEAHPDHHDHLAHGGQAPQPTRWRSA